MTPWWIGVIKQGNQSLLFEALHLGTTNISLLDAHKNLEGAKSNGVNESEISDNHSP